MLDWVFVCDELGVPVCDELRVLVCVDEAVPDAVGVTAGRSQVNVGHDPR